MLDYYLLFIGTYTVSSLICFILDTFPNMPLKDEKINKEITKKGLLGLYKKYLHRVAFNVLVLSLPFAYLTPYMFPIYYRPFAIYRFAYEIMLSRIISDITFYALHRLMHYPPLYRYSHKKHHEVNISIGMSALYTDWFDFYLGNVIPTVLMPAIIITNPLTLKLWIASVTVSTVLIAHSGYSNWSTYHDNHHLKFKYNYGTNVFMDKLFGTYCYQ